MPSLGDRQTNLCTSKAITLNQYPSSAETKVRKLGIGWNRAQTFDEKYLIFEIRKCTHFHAGCTFRYVTSLWSVLRMPSSNSTISQHFAAGSLGQQTLRWLVQFSLVNASLCLHMCGSAHRDSGLTASIFLECFKQALITPEDKKTWLQPSNSDCYCTISNPLVASQENGCSFPNRFYLFIYLRKLQSYFKYI